MWWPSKCPLKHHSSGTHQHSTTKSNICSYIVSSGKDRPKKRVEQTKTDYISRLPHEILARILAHTVPASRLNTAIMVKPRQPSHKFYRGHPTFDWSLKAAMRKRGSLICLTYDWNMGSSGLVQGFAALILVSKFFRDLAAEHLDPRDSWVYFMGESSVVYEYHG
jgi:hypothetical protein